MLDYRRSGSERTLSLRLRGAISQAHTRSESAQSHGQGGKHDLSLKTIANGLHVMRPWKLGGHDRFMGVR
jgi:hypothetical protein